VQGVLSGNRIGVLTSDGLFRVKEGNLFAGWVNERSNVKKAYLSGSRIGALGTDNHCYVKDGGLSAGWVDEFANVSACVLPVD